MFKIANSIPLFVTSAACWLCLAAFASPAAAVVTNWQHDPATPGDWFVAANWDNGVPKSSAAYIDNGGTAQIASPGAECDNLYLGYTVGHSGILELSGETSSLLASYDQYVGYYGTGTFTQTSGTNTVSSLLFLGHWPGSSGTYELSGTGQLSAEDEYIGFSGTGTFIQYGGSNTTRYLSISDNGSYVLSGGTLQVTHSALVTGTFDFASGSGSVAMAGLVNLGETGLSGAGSTTFTLGLNSLLIVPAGFNPETEFGEFINHGSHVHNLGSTMSIGPTKTIVGRGTITDHVDIQGSLRATTGRKIDLEGGLSVSGNGSVGLGTGSLCVDNDFSGISDDGELSAIY